MERRWGYLEGSPGLWLGAGAGAAGILYGSTRLVPYVLNRLIGREPPGQGPRVVILGAGFAGLAAAKRLRARLGYGVRVTLIDRNNYHLFTPLLFQVATADISPYDVAYPIRHFTGHQGIDFLRGTVAGVDFQARKVVLDDGEIGYDYLIVTLGSNTNFFGSSSALEYSLPLKSLEDAVAIRHRVLDMLELATRTANPEERRSMLTFVVVGGGATGVETAGSLIDLLNRTGRSNYPTLDFSEARVLVIEASNKLLGQMADDTATRVALRTLRRMGVEIWLGARVQEVEHWGVTTDSGKSIPAGTVVWAAGVRSPGSVTSMDAPHGQGGRLVVNEYLQVEGCPGVYSAGDSSYFEDPETGESTPLLAQAAQKQGEAAGENVARAIEGDPQLPFRFRSAGNTIWLGQSEGVAELGSLVLEGLAGNLAWRGVHVARMPGLRNQLATTLNWTFAFAYQRQTARLHLRPEEKAAELEKLERLAGPSQAAPVGRAA